MVKESRTNKIGEWKHNSCQLMSILVPNMTHSSNVWAQLKKNNEPCAMKVLETGKCQRPRPLGDSHRLRAGLVSLHIYQRYPHYLSGAPRKSATSSIVIEILVGG